MKDYEKIYLDRYADAKPRKLVHLIYKITKANIPPAIKLSLIARIVGTEQR
jgi:hypothetical protein